MAIRVQHGPSMVDYGQAVAMAATQGAANERMQAYAGYLSGLQKQNQDYGLGLGNLSIAQQKAGTEATDSSGKLALAKRELDQGDFKNNLARDKLALDTQMAKDDNVFKVLNADSSYLNAISNIGKTQKMGW